MNEVYMQTMAYAKEHGEIAKWRESMERNNDCKKAIEETIVNDFDGEHLSLGLAGKILDRFGEERVSFVLANTVRHKVQDGRFSRRNKIWAQELLGLVKANELAEYLVVETHPYILNAFIDQTRDLIQEMKIVKEESIGHYDKYKDIFEIYQLKDKECGYRFMGMKYIQKFGMKVDAKDYKKVYEAPLNQGMTLDMIFEKFNINRPDNFAGHSMSVSDVVVMCRNGVAKAFFIDNIGEVELPDFKQQLLIGKEKKSTNEMMQSVKPRGGAR